MAERQARFGKKGQPKEKTTVVIKHGTMNLLVGKKVKSWKKLFFIIDTEQLSFYENIQGMHKGDPTGVVQLPDICSVMHPNPDDPILPSGFKDGTGHCMVIQTTKQSFYLQAETPAELQEWMMCLRLTIEMVPARVVGIKHGYLTKKGKVHRNWQRRWFVISDAALSYFDNKDSDAPLGVIPLNQVISVSEASDSDTSKKGAFSVHTENRSFVIKVEPRSVMHAWLHCVRMLASIWWPKETSVPAGTEEPGSTAAPPAEGADAPAAGVSRSGSANAPARAGSGTGSSGLVESSSGPAPPVPASANAELTTETAAEAATPGLGTLRRLGQHVNRLVTIASAMMDSLGTQPALHQQLAVILPQLGQSFVDLITAFNGTLPLTVRIRNEGGLPASTDLDSALVPEFTDPIAAGALTAGSALSSAVSAVASGAGSMAATASRAPDIVPASSAQGVDTTMLSDPCQFTGPNRTSAGIGVPPTTAAGVSLSIGSATTPGVTPLRQTPATVQASLAGMTAAGNRLKETVAQLLILLRSVVSEDRDAYRPGDPSQQRLRDVVIAAKQIRSLLESLCLSADRLAFPSAVSVDDAQPPLLAQGHGTAPGGSSAGPAAGAADDAAAGAPVDTKNSGETATSVSHIPSKILPAAPVFKRAPPKKPLPSAPGSTPSPSHGDVTVPGQGSAPPASAAGHPGAGLAQGSSGVPAAVPAPGPSMTRAATTIAALSPQVEEATPLEEIIGVAKEAVASTQLVASAANGTDAQLVQAAKICTGLVQKLISCAVSLASEVYSWALRTELTHTHTDVRDRTIQLIAAARKVSTAANAADHRAAVADLHGEARDVALAIHRVVVLANVAAQHRIAAEQLRTATSIIAESMQSLRARNPAGLKGSVDELDKAANTFRQGIDYLADTLSGRDKARRSAQDSAGEEEEGKSGLSKSISMIWSSIYLLISAATDVGMALSDQSLKQHLSRAINAVKDLTIQLHHSVKNAAATERQSRAALNRAAWDGSGAVGPAAAALARAAVAGDAVMGLGAADQDAGTKPSGESGAAEEQGVSLLHQQVSQTSVNVLQIAAVCKSLSTAFANLLDTSSYVGTKDYIQAQRVAASGQVGGGSQNRDEDIWPEPPDSAENVIFSAESSASVKGQREIKAATLNKMVIRLTSEHSVDLKFVKTFITTYRSFTTPYQLFQKLVQRYQVPIPASVTDMEGYKRTVRLPIQLRVCNVLKQWVDTSFEDFDEELLKKIDIFIASNVQANHPTFAVQIQRLLSKKSSERQQREEEAAAAEAAEEQETARGTEDMFDAEDILEEKGEEDSEVTRMGRLKTISNKLTKNIKGGAGIASAVGTQAENRYPINSSTDVITAVEPEELAKQLTLIEFDIYERIMPVEVMKQAWNKPKLKHLATNVLQLIGRFNELSCWVATTILWEERVKQRARVMTKFIQLAEALRRINNYNSVLAILSGLNNAAVYRLNYTKDEVPKKVLQTKKDLEDLMSNNNAYKNYRENLHSVNPPCLPYLGVYLTDITFIDDGNPDEIQGLINYKKRELAYNIIQEIQQYQQVRYQYPRHTQVIAALHQLHGNSDKELYDLSLLREPRNAAPEDIH